jgi:hypothetical protein
MRHRTERLRRAGALVALLLGALFLLAPARPAAADPLGVPLVLPRGSVDLVRQLNRALRVNVLRFSEVPIDDKGTVVRTAVVELVSGAGLIVPPRLALFLPAGDVSLVQQLNQGLPIQPLAVFPMIIYPSFQWVQTALVLISPTVDTIPKLGPRDFLLVLPQSSFILISQVNTGASMSVVRISQVSIGGTSTQTALVVVRQSGAATDPLQIVVPEADLPALIRLNTGLDFQVVRSYEITQGGTVVKVVLVNVTKKPEDLGGGGGF